MGYGQYRFWRIKFISTQGAATPRLARIRFYGNSGAADDWTVPTGGVSDTGKGDANSNNAADASTSTNWITGQSTVTDAWVGARVYGGPCQIKEIGITATNDANFAGAPSAFWVEGSNDDDAAGLPTNWVRLGYVAAGTWTIGSTQTFAFTVVSATDTARITRVAADVAYSAARTARLSTVNAEVLQKPSGVNTRLSAVNALVLTTYINSPTQSGVTLPVVTASLIAGAAQVITHARASSVPSETVVYLGDGVAYLGDTPVTVPAPIVVGASLIPGYASAPGYATATGGTLVTTASLIPGFAGEITYTAPGSTIAATYSLIPGTASALAPGANGATLTTTTSLIPGTATGVWDLGKLLTVNESVLAGNGSGTASVSGATLPATYTLVPGTMAGNALAPGDRATTTFSLIPGSATAETNIVTPAQTLTTHHVVINGLVTGTVNLEGQMLVETDTLIPGSATVSSRTSAVILPFTPSLIKGAVIVDTEVLGQVIHVDFSLPENTLGVVTAGASTSAEVVAFSHQVLEEGVATGTAVTPAEIVSFGHSVINGVLHADANLDPALIFNVSVTLEPGVGFWFIGSPGDVMVEPHVDARMELLAEVRNLTVVVETRAIIVPHEDRAMTLGPRLKKVI